MSKYVCGIDIGTTGVKVMIFDMDGTAISSNYSEYPCTFPQTGWVEQDGNMTWQCTCETSKKAIEKSGLDPKEIVAIGLSTQRCTVTPIDKDGNPLCDAISWQDSRSFEEVDDIKRIVGEEKFYEITGYPLGTVLSVTEIMWWKKHKPEIYENAYLFVLDQERVLHNLGVEGYYQDWSNGSLYGLMDIRKFEWDVELTKQLGIDPDKLPQLVPSGKVLGKVSKEAAELTGFAEGTLLVSGAGDQLCAGIGAGAIKDGVIEVTMGTAGVTLGYMGQANLDPSMKMPCAAHAIAGKWESEGLQNAAGAAFKWYRNEFAFPEAQKAAAEGLDVYDLIDEQIEQVEPGCNGLIFLPYLASSAAPNWDAFARGTFVGFNLGHGRADMARAILEGVTFEAREIIDRMISNGMAVNEICLSGGGSKGAVWCQIQADIYGKPCTSLDVEEATTLGSAILAALGAGLFDYVEQAVDKMLKRKKVYEPNMENHALYNKYFELYKKSYQALSSAGIYEDLVKTALNK